MELYTLNVPPFVNYHNRQSESAGSTGILTNGDDENDVVSSIVQVRFFRKGRPHAVRAASCGRNDRHLFGTDNETGL